MKPAGKTTVAWPRAMVIVPSSTGWRSTSSTSRWNSGSSSRKSTPWWARLISPGRGIDPPPTSALRLGLWGGAREGRGHSRPVPRGGGPAAAGRAGPPPARRDQQRALRVRLPLHLGEVHFISGGEDRAGRIDGAGRTLPIQNLHRLDETARGHHRPAPRAAGP